MEEKERERKRERERRGWRANNACIVPIRKWLAFKRTCLLSVESSDFTLVTVFSFLLPAVHDVSFGSFVPVHHKYVRWTFSVVVKDVCDLSSCALSASTCATYRLVCI